MIDKQKLLQWVEDKKYVYSEPYEEHDTPEDIAMYKSVVMILRVLQRDIERGNLDVEEVAHERSEASSASAART